MPLVVPFVALLKKNASHILFFRCIKVKLENEKLENTTNCRNLNNAFPQTLSFNLPTFSLELTILLQRHSDIFSVNDFKWCCCVTK